MSADPKGGPGSPTPRVGYDLTDGQDRDDRRTHLELISSAISRQASSSAMAKGWSVTIAGAIFGVAVVRENSGLLLLAVVVLFVFSLLDNFYLHNEQRFRDLYDVVVRNEIAPFSMNLSAVPQRRSRTASYRSWSVLYFYLPLIVGGILVTGISLLA